MVISRSINISVTVPQSTHFNPSNVTTCKIEQVLQQKAYPAIGPLLMPIPGSILPKIEDLSQMWPNRRAKLHADR